MPAPPAHYVYSRVFRCNSANGSGGFVALRHLFIGRVARNSADCLQSGYRKNRAAYGSEGRVLWRVSASRWNWLRQYGFAFAECDAQARPECASELHAHGGMGVPFLMVKGAAMKNGFDSDEFVALLKR